MNKDLKYISDRCSTFSISETVIKSVQNSYKLIWADYICGQIRQRIKQGLMAVFLDQVIKDRLMSEKVFNVSRYTFSYAMKRLHTINDIRRFDTQFTRLNIRVPHTNADADEDNGVCEILMSMSLH